MTDISTDTVTLATDTTSYARPLTDFVGEVVHVASFVPAGTALTSVTDWGPIWNAAVAEARAIAAAGGTFHLKGPCLAYTIATTVNMTNLISYGSVIDFGMATITGATAGAAVFDCMGICYLTLRDLQLTGSATSGSTPSIGIQFGRYQSKQQADTNSFHRMFIQGNFTFAAVYNNNAESTSFYNSWISNNTPIAQATGVVSVAGTVVSGAAKVCYAYVSDGCNHWNVPTLAPGGNTQPTGASETTQSFQQVWFFAATSQAAHVRLCG